MFFPKWQYHFTFSSQCMSVLISPHPHQHLLFMILYFDDPLVCEGIAHCGFDFHFRDAC